MCLLSCSPKTMPSAEVNFIGSGERGTLKVKSIGYGKKWKNIDEAKKNAEINAFNAILFRGIPGSDIGNAMVGTNESEHKSNHSDYFREFFQNMRYRTFVMSSEAISPIVQQKGYQKITVALTINLNALRRDLEQSGVIRKFGF